MKRLVTLTALIVYIGSVATAADPVIEAQERLDQFFLHAHETSAQYAVTGLISSTEKPRDGNQDVIYTESLFRKVTANHVTRFEMEVRDPFGNRDTSLYEHNLVSETRALRAFDVKIGSKIQTVDDVRLARMDPTGKMNPVTAVLQSGRFFLQTSQLERGWSEFKFYQAERLRDKGLRARALHHSGRGIVELVFSGTPEWLITRRREFINPHAPIDPDAFNPAVVRDWYLYSDTSAKWKQVSSKKIWVPYLATTWRKASESTREITAQIELRDWKYGKEVPLRLLEESTFTDDTLLQEIDFVELSQLFERPSSTK